MNRIVLYGGGIDSTALALYCADKGWAPYTTLMHVDYGQKACESERKALKWFADKYGFKTFKGTLDLSFSNARIMKGTPIGTIAATNRLELRNLALISYAASYAASIGIDSKIYLGFHVEPEGGAFRDALTEYLRPLQSAMRIASVQNVSVHTPFSHLQRDEILRTWVAYDADLLTHSHTCYELDACGECTHCVTKAAMVKQIQETT